MKPKKVPKQGMGALANMNNLAKQDEVDAIEDLDAETIRTMFLDAGVLKDKTN